MTTDPRKTMPYGQQLARLQRRARAIDALAALVVVSAIVAVQLLDYLEDLRLVASIAVLVAGGVAWYALRFGSGSVTDAVARKLLDLDE